MFLEILVLNFSLSSRSLNVYEGDANIGDIVEIDFKNKKYLALVLANNIKKPDFECKKIEEVKFRNVVNKQGIDFLYSLPLHKIASVIRYFIPRDIIQNKKINSIFGSIRQKMDLVIPQNEGETKNDFINEILDSKNKIITIQSKNKQYLEEIRKIGVNELDLEYTDTEFRDIFYIKDFLICKVEIISKDISFLAEFCTAELIDGRFLLPYNLKTNLKDNIFLNFKNTFVNKVEEIQFSKTVILDGKKKILKDIHISTLEKKKINLTYYLPKNALFSNLNKIWLLKNEYSNSWYDHLLDFDVRKYLLERIKNSDEKIIFYSDLPINPDIKKISDYNIEDYKKSISKGPIFTSMKSIDGLPAVLIENIKDAINLNKNVLLFTSKKGFGVFICNDCNSFVRCDGCDNVLNLRKIDDRKLFCKYCNTEDDFGFQCKNCKSYNIKNVGISADKLNIICKELFLDAEVVLLEDYISSNTKLEDLLYSNSKTKIICCTSILFRFKEIRNVYITAFIYPELAFLLKDSEYKLNIVYNRLSDITNPEFFYICTRSPDWKGWQGIFV